MAWVFNNERSIYAQLVEQIQNRIMTGIYQPGSRLASVRELAGEAEVNPNTMQKALTELERAGLVHAIRTRGRFVTEDQSMIENLKKESALQIIDEFREKMKALGYNDDAVIQLLNETKKENK
ncbi:HTH-type transcriptional repressor yvoA [uncultured Roseburia sp.]|uniref:GntR family transcriptional regulator n=1 Tax=Brotonthovivens ammoniilytica TaxID=2981725 RepID=A0ABT2TKH5_9FIRM|nr:GntR family transcriptional regulator [Brotonthovivens ammoniilytica]MCU6762714.1 GntR family transcriptional regulator [Brotonthovivens ammoniilytica]SCI85782.1 HTH-type transcriptional repressor yvoA [uncultured Roseburia sp.]